MSAVIAGMVNQAANVAARTERDAARQMLLLAHVWNG
jgi:hypothetical protein